MVVNFDCPKSIETYVHRAGRTGRAGKKGTVVTLLTAEDEAIFFDLVCYLKANNQAIPEDLEKHPAAAIKLRPEAEAEDKARPGQAGGPGAKPPTHFEGGMVQRGDYY